MWLSWEDLRFPLGMPHFVPRVGGVRGSECLAVGILGPDGRLDLEINLAVGLWDPVLPRKPRRTVGNQVVLTRLPRDSFPCLFAVSLPGKHWGM